MQASDWCCMHSIFLQILLMFSNVAPPGECYFNTLLCCYDYCSLSVVSCAFSVLCMYSKFGHHPNHLGYLCAKFHFFHDHHCRPSPWRKIAYALNHSLTSLFDAPGTKLALRNNKCKTTKNGNCKNNQTI